MDNLTTTLSFTDSSTAGKC